MIRAAVQVDVASFFQGIARKRGGTRVIYYHLVAHAQIRMILIYGKGIKDDLTPNENAALRKLNEDWRR